MEERLRELTDREKNQVQAAGVNPEGMQVRYATQYEIHLLTATGATIIIFWGVKNNAEV